MRSFLIYLAATCAVALATPAFWWLLANKTSVTSGVAVEADGVQRAVMTGPKAPWPDWAWTPASAHLDVKIWNGAAPGHPAGGYGELQTGGDPRTLLATVRAALGEQGWRVVEYRYEGPDGASLPPRTVVICTLRATRSAPDRTLTYTFTLDGPRSARVFWSDGAPLGPWMTGQERPC
jgi:hypothetical protein